MNEDIRPHAKIFSVVDGGKLRVMYEPLSKTCIIKNCDYYGWIKSIALAAISDFSRNIIVFTEDTLYTAQQLTIMVMQ